MGGLLCTYSKIELLIVELKIRDLSVSLCARIHAHSCEPYASGIFVRNLLGTRLRPKTATGKPPQASRGGLALLLRALAASALTLFVSASATDE